MADQTGGFDRSDLADKTLPRLLSLPTSVPGVVVGLFFVAVTLYPSMLPKSAVAQGVVIGINFMVGYAVGAALQSMWNYLGLPTPRGRAWRLSVRVSWLIVGVLLVSNTWRYVGWQNGLRDTFGMDPISPTVWLLVLPIGLGVAALILVASRSLRKLFNLIIHWFDRHMPKRLALLLGAVAFSLLLWGLWTELAVDAFFATANRVFAPLDAATDEGIARPQSPNRSGSAASLVTWDSLGRQGRNFVATGPSVDELNAYHGGGALEPIRVYVGLKSADTVAARARLALDELIRTDAFSREVLVVATTTGTGKLEANAMDSLDYVTNGDVAVAGVQYSYLSSVISLLADADEVRETSQIVFDTIHDYWSNLPEEGRPEIYLYGLSLGSYGVESILQSIDIVNEPIDGALMVGPPFVNELWYQLVDEREPGSIPATPVYEGGRTVRFTNEVSAVTEPGDEWEGTRIVYLQHASDPIVFYSPDLVFRQPDWLYEGQRGTGISEGFIWIPLVTHWQVLTDMASAGAVPEGFGHLYTPQANADAWIAVIGPDDWDATDTERLRSHLTDRAATG